MPRSRTATTEDALESLLSKNEDLAGVDAEGESVGPRVKAGSRVGLSVSISSDVLAYIDGQCQVKNINRSRVVDAMLREAWQRRLKRAEWKRLKAQGHTSTLI